MPFQKLIKQKKLTLSSSFPSMAAQHQEDPRMSANENEPKTEFPLDCDAYELGTKIGASDKATVYKAICLPEGCAVVAVKSIDLDRLSRSDDDFFGRAWRNTVLSHPNLLPIHCFFDAGDRRAWVVMPFMSHGSIGHIVSSYFLDGLPENCVSVVLRETLNAIAFLHDRGLVHGAIKPGNILVDSDGSVKLADFGLSASAGATTAFSDAMPMRSPYWVAPKVVQSRTVYLYWFKADISAFGMTALELIQERLPLRNISDKKISKSFREMVALCLELDLAKRPSASELLRHRFFKKSEGEDAMVVKNIVQGLPDVDERPSFSDQEDLAVNPDPVVKQVRFGVETIIQPTRTEGFNISSTDPNIRETLGKEANDEHNVEARVSDSEMNRIVMEMLMNLKESLEDQIAGVVRLMELLGGEMESGNGAEAEK